MRRNAVVVFLALLLGYSSGVSTPARAQSQEAIQYTFPAGDVVYPEGVAVHPGNGDFFVGSTANGAIYRGNARGTNRDLQVFLPGGADGRTTAIGMKVNPQDQLFISGGATGMIWMYDAVTGRFLSSFSNGLQSTGTFINDVAIAPDGAAYFTDSLVPVVYRIKADAQGVFRFEFWRDLRGTALEYQQGFNVNGIDVTRDGKYLIVVQSNTGNLYRVDPETGHATLIDLGGASMTNGDGILLVGRTLYVVRNRLNVIEVVRLNGTFTSGEVVDEIRSNDFDVPTTVAMFGNRLYLVNARFTTPPTPQTRYWITAVRR